MRGSKKLICVQRRDGRVQRIERARADGLVDSGKASFISKTRFKALKVGVEPKKGASDASIKKAIRKAHRVQGVTNEKVTKRDRSGDS